MKYARFVENICQEIIEVDPTTIFHPEVAAMFESIADEVQVLWIKNPDGTITAPPEPEGPTGPA